MNNLEYYAQMAANGDRQAYEELYRQTYYVVYYTCLNLIKSEQDAQDVTQDVFVTVLNQIGSLQDKTKFLPWLHRIAVNKCKDFLKKARPTMVDSESLADTLAEENEFFLPEEYVASREKRQIVLYIMKTSLSELEYQTVFLYYFNGLSVPEISEVMECPVETVTYRLSTSRGKIKQGVLEYENKNDVKLYSFAAIPLLASILVSEVNDTYGVGMEPQGAWAMPQMNSQPMADNIINNTAKGVVKNAMKKKLIAGIIAAVLVVGGITAAVLLNKDKDDEKDDKKTTENTTEYTVAITEDEKTTEEITTEATTEATTEEVVANKKLDKIKLKEYLESGDGQDTVSGHIKDIVYEEGTNCALIVLTDDGHLYSYYSHGNGYDICDLGQPSWEINDIDIISSDMSTDRGEVTIFEGNHYYYVQVENKQPTKVVDSIILEGKEIIAYGISESYSGTFNLYCSDGSYYYVHKNDKGDSTGPFIDSNNYLIDFTGGFENIVPDGLEVVDRTGQIALLSDGKIRRHEPGSSAMELDPIVGTEEFTFTKLFDTYSNMYYTVVALTDSNELKILQTNNKNKIEITYSIALPEAELLDLWYNKGTLIIKTTDGYYSCEPEENTSLEPDELFNSLEEDVVDIYGRYMLLSDGIVYEFPYGPSW